MTSIFWHEIPFVRICIPFTGGILVQQATSSPFLYTLDLILGMSVLAAGCLLKDNRRRQQVRTIALTATMFGAGAFVRYLAEPSQTSLARISSSKSNFTANVISASATTYGTKATLRTSALNDDVLVIAYIRDSSRTFTQGDTVVLDTAPELISSPTNPFAFDISRYFRNQGIHLRTFVNADEIIAHQPASGFSLRRKCEDIRTALCQIIRTRIDDPRISAVLEAMVLGVRDGLDDQLTDAYAKSGAIHILAISGLHVGIISFMLFTLIGRIRREDSTVAKVSRVVILLSGIWTFAGLAGLSPSVTRAACMFSIYLIGIMIRRSVKGLNVLACTALIFLCTDPLQLNSLSFQFSYLALAGILIFYQSIHRLRSFKSRIGRFVWSSIVISIAAQLFLIPFLIYYFHQVSIVSLLSGLVAIPAAYAILCGGLMLFLLHFIAPALADIWAHLLLNIVKATNHIMVWLSELPMSYLADLYLSGPEIAILFSGIICIALRILTRQKMWLYASCFLGLTLVATHFVTLHSATDIDRLAVYKSGKRDIHLDFVTDRICYSTLDISELSAFESGEVKSFRFLSRVRRTLPFSIVDTIACIRLVDLPCPGPSSDALSIHSDTRQDDINKNVRNAHRIALVSGACTENLSQRFEQLMPDQVLLSPGISWHARDEVARICAESNIPLHDLYRDGSYYLTSQNTISNETSWQNISH